MATQQGITRPTPAQGMKSLITATAIAATLAGWVAFSAQEPPPLAASATVLRDGAAAPPPAWLLSDPLIPALPPVAMAVATSGGVAAQVSGPAVAQVSGPAVAVAAPVPPPALRAVAAALPPAPVASTRSSR